MIYPSSDGYPISRCNCLVRARILDRLLGRWPDLLAVSLLMSLVPLLLVRQIVLGGALYDVDMLLMSIPVYSWYSEQLRQGVLPFWSSSVMGGAPLAFVIYGFLYPPDILLFRVLDAARAFYLSLALHVGLAGVCTYWYCRVLGLRRLPSLLAAVAFQMGTEVLTWPSNGFVARTLFVLPALLATIELMFRGSPRYWLLTPLVVGAGLLGGYAQVVLFALAVAAAYCVVVVAAGRGAITSLCEDQPRRHEGTKLDQYRSFVSSRLRGCRMGFCRAPTTRTAILLAGGLALGVALGIGLAAVRVAPTLAVTALSTRSAGMDLTRSAIDSIEPWVLVVGYLLPAVAEMPGVVSRLPDYVGVPALILTLLAVASGRGLGRVGWFHAGLAAATIVLSLGEFTPVYGLLLQVPFFSLFRGPNRISLVAALSLAVLAALALDRRMALELPASKRLHRVAIGLSATTAVAGSLALVLSVSFQFGGDSFPHALRDGMVAGGWDRLNLLRPRVGLAVLAIVASPLLLLACARRRISHGAFEWFLVALSAVTLFGLGWAQNSWMPPSALYEPPALLQRIKQDPDLFRVFAWAPRVSTYNVGVYYRDQMGFPAPGREFEERYLRQFLPANLGMLFGVATPEWYDALQTRRQAVLANYLGSESAEVGRLPNGDLVDWRLHSLGLRDRLNLLAALNVKYVTNAFPVDDPRLEPAGEVSVQIYPQLPAVARVYLYRLRNALPRAFAVPRAVVMPDEQQVLETLLAGTVELRQRAILEQEPPQLPGAPLTAGGSSVDVLEYRDGQVSLAARTDGSGYLVLMDFLMPGWTATVDGRPEPVLAANFAGRAVPLRGPGEHHVVFRYDPPLFREGLLVSLLCLALLVAVPVVWTVRGARRPLALWPVGS